MSFLARKQGWSDYLKNTQLCDSDSSLAFQQVWTEIDPKARSLLGLTLMSCVICMSEQSVFKLRILMLVPEQEIVNLGH